MADNTVATGSTGIDTGVGSQMGINPIAAPYDPFAMAANTTAQEGTTLNGDSGSIMQDISDVTFKGLPLAAASAVLSFKNMPADIGNWFGMDNHIEDMSEFLGTDSTLLPYYQAHSTGVDVAGALLGSFIPGGLATKALRAAEVVNAIKTTGQLPETVSRFTGLLPSVRKELTLAGARNAIEANPLIYGNITQDTLKAAMWGTADAALQGAAWEAATIATMHANPTMQDDGLGDSIDHIFRASVFGAGLFAVPSAIGSYYSLNRFRTGFDIAEKGFEEVTKQGAGNFIVGDKVAQMLAGTFSKEDAMVAATPSQTMKAANRANAVKLDAINQIATVSDDNVLANKFVDTIYNLRDQGLPLEGQASQMGLTDYTSQLSRISRAANPEYLTEDASAFFLNQYKKGGSPSNWMTSSFDDAADASIRVKFNPAFDQNAFKVGMYGDPLTGEGSSVGGYKYLAPTANDAWNQGMHLWQDANGKLHINPDMVGAPNGAKPIWKLAEDSQVSEDAIRNLKNGKIDPEYAHLSKASTILNTKTGAITKDFVPTVGDLTSDISLLEKGNALRVGDDVLNYGPSAKFAPFEAGSKEGAANLNMATSGHYAWAELRGLKAGDVIEHDNLPMLEKAAEQMQKSPEDAIFQKIQFKDTEGDVHPFWDNVDDLRQHIANTKQEFLRQLHTPEMINEFGADTIAHRLNTSRQWVLNGGDTSSQWSDISQPLKDHLDVTHMRLVYDVTPAVQTNDGNLARGMQAVNYRIRQIQEATNASAASFFKDAYNSIKVRQRGAADATANDNSAGFLKFAQGDYGTLASYMQAAGRTVSNVMTKVGDAIVDHFNPAVQALRGDASSAAKLMALSNALQRTGEKYILLDVTDAGLKAQAEKLLGRALGDGESVVVPRKAIKAATKTNPASWDTSYVPSAESAGKQFANFIPADQLTGDAGKAVLNDVKNPKNLGFYTVDGPAADYLRTHVAVNDNNISNWNNWAEAANMQRTLEPGVIYFPGRDVRSTPYHAFVRYNDGFIGGDSSTSMLWARSAEELQQKIALLGEEQPHLRIITGGETKDYLKARGEYEFNRYLNSTSVDTAMHRSGVMADTLPDMNLDNFLSRQLSWQRAQQVQMVRNYTELANGQLLSELNLMGKSYDWMAQSRKGWFDKVSSKSNPYDSLSNQLLNISNRSEYTLWNQAQEFADKTFSKAFTAVQQAFGKSYRGAIPFEQAAEVCRQYGFGDVYGTTLNALRNYNLASQLNSGPALERFVRGANTIMATCGVRIDTIQAMIEAVSTPILMIPEITNAARKLGAYSAPSSSGEPMGMWSAAKLMADANAEFFKRDSTILPQVQAAMKNSGYLTVDQGRFHAMMDDLALRGSENPSQLQAKLGAAVEKAATLAGSNWSENYARTIGSIVAFKLGSAAGLAGQDLEAMMNTFTSRVHGAATAAQRPVAFQGPIGAAIGLFQSYQFNLMQQVFRYIGEGDYKALALLGGLQCTLFGMQGFPGFQAINQAIIGNARNNPAHSDIYSTSESFFGNKLADFVLYGAVSDALGVSVYNRGDINPRQITVLPVNPADIPFVNAATNVISNIWDSAKKLNDGGNFWNVFTEGLEHNGLSRPLSGLAQVAQGYTTTGSGSLVSVNRPTNDIAGALAQMSMMNAARLVGAKPLDEGIIMDALYRRTAYQAADTATMENLGAAVKASLRGDSSLDEAQMDRFATRYVAAGGWQDNFSSRMLDWARDANTAVANQLYSKLQTPFMQNTQRIMGGVQLPDYSNQVLLKPAAPDTGQQQQ